MANETIQKIKERRLNYLTSNERMDVLDFLENALVTSETAVIVSPIHVSQPWEYTKGKYDVSLTIPKAKRPAVTEFLQKEGFNVIDYYNSHGVNYGLLVSFD